MRSSPDATDEGWNSIAERLQNPQNSGKYSFDIYLTGFEWQQLHAMQQAADSTGARAGTGDICSMRFVCCVIS